MFFVFPRIRLRISVFALPSMLLMLWLEGIIPFLIILLSASFHELGHILSIHRLGYRIRRIDILPMGALIVVPEGIPHRDEYRIAVSGPLFSIAAALVSLVLFLIMQHVELAFALVINLVFGFVNLLPIKKLDGGKALFSFVAQKNGETSAERVCKTASTLSTLFFLILALMCLVLSDFNLGAILLCAVLVFGLFER